MLSLSLSGIPFDAQTSVFFVFFLIENQHEHQFLEEEEHIFTFEDRCFVSELEQLLLNKVVLAVVLVQLAERLLLTPEICGLNPDIGNEIF